MTKYNIMRHNGIRHEDEFGDVSFLGADSTFELFKLIFDYSKPEHPNMLLFCKL